MATPSRIGGYEVTAQMENFVLGETLAAVDDAGEPYLLVRLDGERLKGRADPEAIVASVNRFRDREAEGLLPLVGAGVSQDDLIVVLRATDGPTLADILARGTMAPARALGIGIRIARTLEGLIDEDVVHGDIRPSAVHLPGGGEALLGPPEFLPLAPDERDLRTLAPEVLDGAKATAASDVFALGALLYFALTARPPFTGRSASEVRGAIRSGILEDPSKHTADIPAGLPELLLEMLDEDPAKRPADVVTRLVAVEKGEPILTPVSDPPAASVSTVPTPASAPGTPMRAARAAAAAPRAASKDRSGRLLLPLPGREETPQHDLVGEVTHLGLTASGRVVARDQPAPEPICRLLREDSGDVALVAAEAKERPRVNGSLFDRHELRDGDVLSLGGQDVRYTLAPPARRVTSPPPATTGREEARGAERMYLAVSAILCVLILGGLLAAHGNVRRRGQSVFADAEKAERSKEAWRPRVEQEASRRAAAAAALDEALALGSDRARDREARLAALRQVIADFSGTEEAVGAATELDRMIRETEEAERRDAAEIDRKADRLIGEGRLHDARTALYELASRWPASDTADRAMRRASRIAGEIVEQWERDLKTIEAMCRDGDVPGALSRLDAVSVYGGPTVRQKAKERVEALRKMIQETMLKEGAPAAREPDAPDAGPGPEDPTAGGTPEPTPPPPPPPPDPKAKTEERAQKLVDRAWNEARAGKWPQVRELTRLLLMSFAATNAVADDLSQLEVLDRYASLTVEGQLGRLHGRVETLSGGRVRVSYDFSDPAQAKDWEYLLPFSGEESGTFGPVPGKATIRGKSRGAYVLDLVLEGDLKMGFRIRSEKPHDVGALLFDPYDPYRQVMFTVNNTFFTLGAEKSPLEGNVIALWGKTVWAANPKGELGFVRIAEKKTPVVQPGQWTYLAVGRKGEQVSFSIENDTIAARARGDDNLPYGDLKPSLFVLDSEADFTDIVIEGRPSRAWLANEKKRLLEILNLK